MTVPAPDWLPLRPLPAREAELAAVRRALATGGPVTLVGGPGAGKTRLAGALLADTRGAWCAASFAGCEDGDDALRALGAALGVCPVGDERRVQTALQALGGGLLFADDVTEAPVAEALRRLADVGGVRLVVASERPWDGAVVALAGEAATGPPLPPFADVLAAWPMGLPGERPADLPVAALVADPGRLRLRRALAAGRVPSPDAAARALPFVQRLLLRLGRGAHLDTLPDVRDLLLLRRLARELPDRHGPLARAAAARLAAVFGQAHVAHALLSGAPAPEPIDRAVLAWADADVRLFAGALDEAVAGYEAAAALYARLGDDASRAAVLRRAGDRLAARGELPLAEEAYRRAGAVYRAVRDARGLASTQRGSAALALASGGGVGVAVLHDQAEAGLLLHADAELERVNLRLGQVTLAAGRGETMRARARLAELPSAGLPPLALANAARRRADIALRAGELDVALAEADDAFTRYAALGEVPSAAAATRLCADAHGLRGETGAALARYVDAIDLHVRTRDLRGLARTLDHAASVAEWAGEPELARRWREQRSEVARLLD